MNELQRMTKGKAAHELVELAHCIWLRRPHVDVDRWNMSKATPEVILALLWSWLVMTAWRDCAQFCCVLSSPDARFSVHELDLRDPWLEVRVSYADMTHSMSLPLVEIMPSDDPGALRAMLSLQFEEFFRAVYRHSHPVNFARFPLELS